jgi:hypothetical protein
MSFGRPRRLLVEGSGAGPSQLATARTQQHVTCVKLALS